MPPLLALALCTLFIGWLFRQELRLSAGVSPALWLPFAWIVIIGSRFPSEWLAGPAATSTSAYLEGSSLDRNVFLGLILVGFVVLMRRRVSLATFTRHNVFIVLFFAYTLASMFWSDFPLVAFKRWHKVLGHVVMALVVLTDPEPTKAFQALFRRCAYILIPLSVVTIKYFPQMSRGFDAWTGQAYNAGITVGKNALGNASMVMGLFFVTLLFAGSRRNGAGKADAAADVVLAGMTFWLLNEAHSATSLGCLVLGGVVIVAMRARPIAKNFSALVVTLVIIAGVLQVTFNLRDAIILGLGRDTTLTGRTELWESLSKIPVNPVIGVGFESFWVGERVEGLWKKYWWKPNQAHNGYYEMYLNLGYIGVTLQLGMMLAGYLTARKTIQSAMLNAGDSARFAMARFSTGFLIALAAYSFTEAAFKALHLSFFVFFLVATEYPPPLTESAAVAERSSSENGMSARSTGASLVTVPASRSLNPFAPSWTRVRARQGTTAGGRSIRSA